MSDRETTQIFEIRNILIEHCGKELTPDLIDKISKQIEQAMAEGPCSWAFKEKH
jgi:hypothetical protein